MGSPSSCSPKPAFKGSASTPGRSESSNGSSAGSARTQAAFLATRHVYPFDDRSFNIVFSCGLLEHIGVYEEWEPAYRARPSPNQFEERKGFLAECLRVLRQPGVLYIDHPNGAFPLDFWHYTGHTGFRSHSPSEGFLPDFDELVQLLRAAGWKGSIEAISPAGRFEFKQVGRRWWGRLLTWPAKGLLNLINQPGFARLTPGAFSARGTVWPTRPKRYRLPGGAFHKALGRWQCYVVRLERSRGFP